ncbi:hypothetical protein BJP40_05945 [Streptomyces sp. CC53]|uniref:hypothetical protein n=1 Tax=Streptomyces sp. CC53 TaxID=1906740 RepID=UPI0008DC6D0B|nr:hypothetical protein [Streptomyces sp. CC53]OII61313.1 hypothetical protein BJP40_05945 [Streptomyces sp. CC53]
MHYQHSSTAASPQGDDLDVRESYTKKAEFAPHVTVSEETFFGHGWQPLTIAFLQALWFLPHDATFDVPFLVRWLDDLGWKGANGKPLGERTVLRELGLLRKAGYVQSHRLRGEGGKSVGIQYTVSQRRIDQPETGTWIPAPEDFRSSDHMSPLATCGGSPHVANEDFRSSDHMSPLATCGGSPHVANDAKAQVAPHVGNEVPPPHPPEEVTTSSPYPPTGPAGSLPSQLEGEGGGFAEEDLRAAADVLQLLPDPWTQGRLNATKLAPKLLGVMAEQGWPGIREVDQALLTRQLTKNPHKVTNPYRLLAGDRIPNLPRYAVVASAGLPSGASADGMCPKHPQYRAGRRCIPCAVA